MFPAFRQGQVDRFSRSRLAQGRAASLLISPDVLTPPRSQHRPSKAATLRPNLTLRGRLSHQDAHHPLRSGRFADDFVISGGKTERRIEIRLRSRAFDAYLELINDRTGRSILFGDDISTRNTNARMVFMLKAGDRYRVRVSSASRAEAGDYTLVSATMPTALAGFNFYYGYGRVDAAQAVAQALGQPTRLERTAVGAALSVGPPNRSGYSDYYHRPLDQINAPNVWKQGVWGQGITIAVIDDGVDFSHPELASSRWINAGEIADNGIDDDGNGLIDDVSGWNFVDRTSQPVRQEVGNSGEHGTHVAGIIAAANDGKGITGVAPAAKIMALRAIAPTTDTRSPKFDTDLATSITYAVNHGARVINLSLGNYTGDPAMTNTYAALKFAAERGVVVVAAAGNEREDLGTVLPIQPALYAREGLAIAVGALERDRRMATFSNPAGDRPYPFVVAPGTDIYSTGIAGDYLYKSGTSMAAPYVAGVVALMLSANPKLTPTEVASILTETANAAGIDVI